MAFATKEELVARLERITKSTDGISSIDKNTLINDILEETQSFILETLVSKGWAAADLITSWVSLKTTHLDIATYNFLVKIWVAKVPGKPELLEELKSVKDNLKDKEILFDSSNIQISRGKSRLRVSSSSDGKGRVHFRAFDEEESDTDIINEPLF